MVFAYIDPGAGSMVVQALLAAALAIPFFLRTQLTSLVQRMRGKRPDSDDQPQR